MQKIFKKYLFFILMIAMSLLLLLGYTYIINNLVLERNKLSNEKLNQITATIESNEVELDALTQSLDESYLLRARAVAYLIEKDASILEDVSQLQRITELLDVDDVHVTDENGIIAYSSVPENIGLDFHENEQTLGFLPILYGEKDYVIQEIRPNAAEGKLMQYIGVKRPDQAGIVQVGLKPTRLLEAQKRNQYSYMLDRIPTDAEEDIFIVNRTEEVFFGHTNQNINAESKLYEYNYTMEELLDCQDGKILHLEGKDRYVVTRLYEDIVLGISISKEAIYGTRAKEMLAVLIYLLIVGVVVSYAVNKVLYKTVIRGIHTIVDDLEEIGNGNLEKVVNVGGNPEMESLSNSINKMVQNILSTMMRISKIIEITDIPMASFECRKDMNKVFVTSRLKELLRLKEGEEQIFHDQALFFDKLDKIKENSVPDEKDIYCVDRNQYIKLIVVEDDDNTVGSIIDVSEEYLEKKVLQHKHKHDSLTNLKNYRAFKESVEEILHYEDEQSLMAGVMLDLDEFKSINDTYGHDFGDEYLIAFADILRELPSEHCVIARRSGDEFCFFVYGYQKEDEIIRLLEALWRKIEQTTIQTQNGENMRFQASGGVAWVKERDFGIIMREADEILYQAKHSKKGLFTIQVKE